MKTAGVLGAGGFIGSHLVTRLASLGYHVTGIDLKYPQFAPTAADKFIRADLRDPYITTMYLSGGSFDRVYQLAADMGGAGFVFTGEHDADILRNNALINLNVCHALLGTGCKLFYSSSACVYPEGNQLDPDNPVCTESSAYPADPDSDYGWEKLFSERIYQAFARNYDLDIRIARFHNVMGPQGSWNDGREKAPAAICRKVCQAKDSIEIWGDGKQTRSFLYIDDCLDAIELLMQSEVREPLNIGSEEMVSINNLISLVMDIAGKDLDIVHIPGPQGVRGRCSDNTLISALLNWSPKLSLRDGLEKLYHWIEQQCR